MDERVILERCHHEQGIVHAAHLYKLDIPIVDYVFGLGGREIKPGQIEGVYRDLVMIADGAPPLGGVGEFTQPVTYLGVRGEEDYQSAVSLPGTRRNGEK